MPLNLRKPTVKTIILHVCVILAAFQLVGCSSREQRAKSYYDHGMSYIENKDFVKARIELKNALQIQPNMVEAWRALAQMDEHDRNFQALAGELRKITELEPKDVDSKLRLGRLFLLGGALDEALKMANAANDIEPQNVSTLALKAAVLLRLKDSDGATHTAEKALEIDPGNTEASIVLAATKLGQGNPKDALTVLDNVKNDKKDDFGVVFLEINIYERLGDLTQVESLLRKLVTLYPKEQAFRAQLVRFYILHKRQDEAVKELRTAVTDNPNDASTELNLVNLLGSLKGPEAAREELTKRIAAGGEVYPYEIALAKTDFVQGKFEDSKTLLEKLIGGSTKPDDVMTARITLAEMYMSKNDIASAEPIVTEILSTDGRNLAGLMMRSSIHMSRNQIDDAIADLRTGLNDQPQSPPLLVNLAIAYERGGSIELADKAFLDATKASKYNPTIGLNYVAFLRRRGLADQADKMVGDLAARNPNNVPVLSALARVKLAHQDWSGAHAIADSLHRLGEKSDLADQINGAAFSGEKKFDSSLTSLQNAYDANPGAAQPMAALVSAYIQSKEVDKAEAFLQSALKANPGNAEALVLMGSVQLVKNDADKAIANFEAAIKQQPKNVVGYRALADLYIRQRKNDDGLRIIRAGLQQQPHDFSLQLTLASLLELKGDYEGAIATYEAMLKQQPGSMIVANNLASLLADHRNDKASIDRANSLAVLLKSSGIPQFKDTLGWVAYHRDDYTAAISLLEGAKSELPNNPLVLYHLGMSYLATGQDAKASEQFKKARELAPNDADLKMKIDSAAPKARSDKTKG